MTAGSALCVRLLPTPACRRGPSSPRTKAALIEDKSASAPDASVPLAAENSLDPRPACPGDGHLRAPKRDVSRTLRLRDGMGAAGHGHLVAAEFALLELEESQQDEEESFVDFARLREQLDSRL